VHLQGKRQSLLSRYEIPRERPLHKIIGLSATLDNEELADSRTDKLEFAVSLRDTWRNNWKVNQSTSLIYENEEEDDKNDVHYQYILPAISLDQTIIAPGPDPLHGRGLHFTLAGSTEFLGSETDFLRATARVNKLWHLGKSHTLLTRVEVGALLTDHIEDIPISQRFFAGGDQSIRGFDYKSLGPEDADGDIVGGKYLNTASIEYSLLVKPRWRLAFFADTGRAYNNSNADWHTGAGIGVRWISPVGQIRADLATPVDDDEEDGFSFHVSIGAPL
jgi:translocation and assembly module TamA